MSASLSLPEREALATVEKRLVGLGYTVVREPAPALLPAFLRGFRPDAIATGKEPSLLIEVIAGRGSKSAAATRVKQLQQLLEVHPGWGLEVVYTAPSTPLPEPVPLGAIRRRFDEVRRIQPVDPAATLILCWSLFEATARNLVPDQASRALTPATTAELLTSHGYIEQAEADVLRSAIQVRNLVVHGDLTRAIDPHLVDRVLAILGRLLKAADA